MELNVYGGLDGKPNGSSHFPQIGTSETSTLVNTKVKAVGHEDESDRKSIHIRQASRR